MRAMRRNYGDGELSLLMLEALQLGQRAEKNFHRYAAPSLHHKWSTPSLSHGNLTRPRIKLARIRRIV